MKRKLYNADQCIFSMPIAGLKADRSARPHMSMQHTPSWLAPVSGAWRQYGHVSLYLRHLFMQSAWTQLAQRSHTQSLSLAAYSSKQMAQAGTAQHGSKQRGAFSSRLDRRSRMVVGARDCIGRIGWMGGILFGVEP